MTVYELSCDRAAMQGISVREEVTPYAIKGLYYEDEDTKVVAISNRLETEVEKNAVLFEERGHGIRGGNILFGGYDQVMKRKIELEGKGHGYAIGVPIRKLTALLKRGLYFSEIAEELCVTEKYVTEAVDYYITKGKLPRYNHCEDQYGY